MQTEDKNHVAESPENVQGVEAEIAGLRMLERGLLERLERAENPEEEARLGKAFTVTATRLAEMIKAEKQLEGSGKMDPWEKEFLPRLDELMREHGYPSLREQMLKEAQNNDDEHKTTSRRLEEEIAGMRHVLKNTFKLAMAAQESRAYLRLVENYSSGCVRLARLLKIEGTQPGQLQAYFSTQMQKVIRELTEELGIRDN